MRTDLVRIGNSRGIRIPKPLIQQCGLGDSVELRVEKECIIISSQRRSREGWEEKFRACAASGKDEPLLEPATNEFDRSEWRW